MDTHLIHQATQATLTGELPFPQIVDLLVDAGVEFYHIDYIARRKTCYDANGSTVETPLPLEGLPPVAAGFDAEALRANIRDSQQNHQPWRDFSIRAARCGVQGYFAFLRGKRVTYLGRLGDQHTEWFPGARPETDPWAAS